MELAYPLEPSSAVQAKVTSQPPSYSGLNETVPQCQSLNTWFPVGTVVWGGLGGVAL